MGFSKNLIAPTITVRDSASFGITSIMLLFRSKERIPCEDVAGDTVFSSCLSPGSSSSSSSSSTTSRFTDVAGPPEALLVTRGTEDGSCWRWAETAAWEELWVMPSECWGVVVREKATFLPFPLDTGWDRSASDPFGLLSKSYKWKKYWQKNDLLILVLQLISDCLQEIGREVALLKKKSHTQTKNLKLFYSADLIGSRLLHESLCFLTP